MSFETINELLDRIVEGRQTELDIKTLRKMLSGIMGLSASPEENQRHRQVLLQLSKYNVNIAEGRGIHIGDRTYVRWDDEAIQALIAIVQKQLLKPIGIPENLPRSGVAKFVGREQELETLHQQLQQNERVAVSAIAGMGGIGKTELALQYAIKYRQDYQGGICWIQARGVDVGTQIVQFARSRLQLNPPENLDLAEQAGFYWAHWQPGKVLVVLDDVVDFDVVKLYLPPIDDRFKVVITSRLQLGKPFKQLELKVLDEPRALMLLQTFIGEKRIQAELEITKELCAWLGCLPLGLELVGRYLEQRLDLSIATMLAHLKEKRLQARGLQHPHTGMTARLGVADAFELTWDTLDEPTKQLGCLLSLFAQASIPWFLLSAIVETEEELWDLQEDRTVLIECHLLQCLSEETYRLHELIREFFRVKLEQSDSMQEFKQTFADLMVMLSHHIPYTIDIEVLSGIAPEVLNLDIKLHISSDRCLWQQIKAPVNHRTPTTQL